MYLDYLAELVGCIAYTYAESTNQTRTIHVFGNNCFFFCHCIHGFTKAINKKTVYEVKSSIDEACIYVNSTKEPKAKCKISVTSPLMRTHPFRYYNGKFATCDY